MRDSTRRWYRTPFTETVISWSSMSMARPLVSRLQGPLGEHAGNMALIVGGGMNAAARINHGLCGRRDVANCLFGRRMPH